MTTLKFFCAASLLAASSAFAATAPTAAPGTARAASPATVPATTTPAAPDHHCRNEANEKHLTGAARAAFIKKCRADTSAR